MVTEPIGRTLGVKVDYDHRNERHTKPSYCIVPVNPKQFVTV
jgi:hypothetical protein